MANWPTSLPAPLLSEYAVEPQAAVIRTQMESGPARYRKRFTNVPYDVSVKLMLTAAQMATFKSFYHTDINLGADWFGMPALDLGAGYVSISEAHIVGQPNYVKLGRGLWNVTFKLEVRNA